MGDYSSPMRMAFQRENAERNKQSSAQTASLFEAIMNHKNQQAMQDSGNAAKLEQMDKSAMLDQAKEDRNLNTAKDLVTQNPDWNINLGGSGGVGLSKQKTAVDPNATVRRDNLHRMLIKDVASDYDKRTQGVKTGMQAAQSVINALDAGDIQTLGQIKANLPRLEGEKFKPTDAERQMMLQPTGQGAFERLSNYFKGDNAAISDTQKSALRKIVQQKIENAQKDMSGSQNEVTTRWGHRISELSPEEQQDLSASLGSSAGSVIKAIPGQGKAIVKKLRNKTTGQTKIVYSDGSEEMN